MVQLLATSLFRKGQKAITWWGRDVSWSSRKMCLVQLSTISILILCVWGPVLMKVLTKFPWCLSQTVSETIYTWSSTLVPSTTLWWSLFDNQWNVLWNLHELLTICHGWFVLSTAEVCLYLKTIVEPIGHTLTKWSWGQCTNIRLPKSNQRLYTVTYSLR